MFFAATEKMAKRNMELRRKGGKSVVGQLSGLCIDSL